MKTPERTLYYQHHGPTMGDALEALERQRIVHQRAIEVLQGCMDAGVLGCYHEKLSARREGVVPIEIRAEGEGK